MSKMENNKTEALRQGLAEQALTSEQLNQVAGGVTTGDGVVADTSDDSQTTSAARIYRITNIRGNATVLSGGGAASMPVIPSI